MKRLILPIFLLVAWSLTATPATIQVKEASLYAKPSATAKFLGRVPYGTKLTVLEAKNDWAQVKAEGRGLTGWVRTQAYTSKPLDLKAGGQTSGVSTTEVSLAGRGFTEEVEGEYKKSHPNLDFAALDRMEEQEIPEAELDDFLRDGGLAPDGERQ